MAKRKKQNGRQSSGKKNRSWLKIRFPKVALPEETNNWIWGIFIFVIAAILFLSFFDMAGTAGVFLKRGTRFLIGKAFFLTPFIFVFGGIVFFTTKYKKFFGPTLFAIAILVLGISGILGGISQEFGRSGLGGLLGYLVSFLIIKYFGLLVNNIVFSALILFGVLIFWYLLKPQSALRNNGDDEEGEEPSFAKATEGKGKSKEFSAKEPSLIKKIFCPQFKVKEIYEPTAGGQAAE